MSEPKQGWKARARAEMASGGKANLDPRAVEKRSRSSDTKVAKGARGKGRGTKEPVGSAAKLATNRLSARTPFPCRWRKDKEMEEIN